MALLAGGATSPAAGQTMTPAKFSEGAEAPVGTGFTYQGLLSQSGVPDNGAWDFELTLFDAAVGASRSARR